MAPISINGSGSITGISAGGLPDGSITADDIAAGAVTRAKMGYAGAILQVVSSNCTGETSTNSNSWVNYLTATITPTSASSKILILHTVTYGGEDNSYAAGRVYRSGSGTTNQAINGGQTFVYTENRFTDSSFSLQVANSSANAHYKLHQGHFHFLDSPNSTGAVTYTFAIKADGYGRWAYINKVHLNPGDGYNARPNTTATLIEVAA